MEETLSKAYVLSLEGSDHPDQPQQLTGLVVISGFQLNCQPTVCGTESVEPGQPVLPRTQLWPTLGVEAGWTASLLKHDRLVSNGKEVASGVCEKRLWEEVLTADCQTGSDWFRSRSTRPLD